MVLKMYSVRDSKANVFNQPFFAHTHGEAERMFTRNARDNNSQIHHFPEDYDLFYVGDYDDQEGKIVPQPTPIHVIKAVQVRERQ